MAIRFQAIHYLFANKQAMLQENFTYHKKVAEEVKQPYHSSLQTQMPRNPLAEMGISDFNSARIAFVKNEAYFLLLKMVAALERYKDVYGRYPKRLEQLVSTYLSVVPLDPFGSLPLR